MSPRTRLVLFGGVLSLFVSLQACSCDDDELKPLPTVQIKPPCEESGTCECPPDDPDCDEPPPLCTTDADCPEHECCQAGAAGAAATCAFCPRACTDDTQCCPGQTCNETLGRCFDKFDECVTDEDCGREDRVCVPYTNDQGQTTQRCDFRSCASDAECVTGQRCFSERCIGAPPCGGGCDAGEVCVLANDRCQPDPDCTVAACGGGFLMVYDDPDNVYDDASCAAPLACGCVELPPLTSDDMARWAASAAANGKLFVSAYDGQYGDLVLHVFNLATNQREGTEWVDGVPATGTVVGGPSGARNGIADEGENVGRYTDVAAAADGTVHVSYYDVDRGDLKYGRRAPDGTWTTFTVDGVDGADVGRGTSIALDAGGKPTILFFQAAGADDATRFMTGLKIAKAATATPATGTDFTLATLDAVERPIPPCRGGCAVGEGCLDDGGAGTCTATIGGCDLDPGTPALEACATGDVCIDRGGAPTCVATLADESLAGDLVRGVGLMPSLAFKANGGAVAAYYDAKAGALRALELTGTTVTAGPTILEGGLDPGGLDPGDAGWHPAVAILADGGTTMIVSNDVTHHELSALLFSGSVAAGAQVREVIDAGAAAGEVRLVGADASLVATPAGDVVIAYQDQTGSDLVVKLRSRTSGAWEEADRVTDGAVGFFSDVAWLGGKSYVTHAGVHAGIPRLQSELLLQPPFDAP